MDTLILQLREAVKRCRLLADMHMDHLPVADLRALADQLEAKAATFEQLGVGSKGALETPPDS